MKADVAMLSNFAEHIDVFGETTEVEEKNSSASGVNWPVVPNRRRSDAPYLEALGLYLNPFTLTNDEKFYFESPALKQRLQTLLHMVETNKGLLCVTGDAGGGKTTLLKQFVSLAKESWQPFEINVGSVSNERQILAKVATGINAPVCRYQFSGILSRVQLLNDDNRFPVLVIDDAHKLSEKIIVTLQKLKQKIIKKNLNMGIVFFADKSIKSLLNSSELRDTSGEWVYSIYLPRLSEKDTADYIQHRMTVAGMLIDKPFKPADIKAIYKMAKGLPRNTNETAHRMLACNYSCDNKKKIVPIAQVSWIQGVENVVKDNWVYMVMGVLLLAMFFSMGPARSKLVVETGQSNVSDKESITVTKSPTALVDQLDSSSVPDKGSVQKLQMHSARLTPVSFSTADCDASIFLDCLQGKGKVQKKIYYK